MHMISIRSPLTTLIHMGQAITIVHNPEDFRLMSYAYLTNIYSLLISALISMLNVGLTQNDAVFVIVATISPATVYLWITAVHALFRGFPKRIDHLNKHEGFFLIALSFTSFALWATILGLIIRPSHQVKFSQPGCNKDYGKPQLLRLFWSALFLGQLLFAGAVIFGIAVYLRWRAQKQFLHLETGMFWHVIFMIFSLPISVVDTNLIGWTRTSIKADFKFLHTSPRRVAALLFIMQIPDTL